MLFVIVQDKHNCSRDVLYPTIAAAGDRQANAFIVMLMASYICMAGLSISLDLDRGKRKPIYLMATATTLTVRSHFYCFAVVTPYHARGFFHHPPHPRIIFICMHCSSPSIFTNCICFHNYTTPTFLRKPQLVYTTYLRRASYHGKKATLQRLLFVWWKQRNRKPTKGRE